MKPTKTYQISPIHLRRLNVEITRRTRDNAYEGHNDLAHWTREQKQQAYDTLKDSIQENGIKPPIIIMFKPHENQDALLQGHHRLNIAIELNLSTIPVQFTTHE